MEKSEKLGPEIHFLGRLLGGVIREQAGLSLYELEEEIRLGARARREGKPGAESALLSRVSSITAEQARLVVRAFTVFFDLANLAEDRERVRVLRDRERRRHPEPRSESMEEAVLIMRRADFSPEQAQALIDLLAIELVFTAHPTEAKRRSVRGLVRRMRRALEQMDDEGLLPRDRDRLVTLLRSSLTSLWQTELREASPAKRGGGGRRGAFLRLHPVGGGPPDLPGPARGAAEELPGVPLSYSAVPAFRVMDRRRP